MALRYLELNQPQYVPTYTPIDPQLLSKTDASIQQQGEQFRQQKREVFDVAANTAIQELGNLPDRDVQYARSQFEKSRQNIRNIAEERGARESMPFLEEEARRLQTELQPLREAAQFKKQAITKLDENENIPASVRASIIGEVGGIYDEQGNLTEVKADINQTDLAIGANWESIPEFLDDFNSKARKANIEEGRFDPAGGGFATQTASGEVNDYRRIVEAISGDDIMMSSMQALMSNEKMKEQLDLLAKIKLKQDDPTVGVNEEGQIVSTEYVPKVNSQGDYVDERNRVVKDFRQAAVEKKKITYRDGALWQAAQKSKPFAERDSYYRSKYETQKATGQKSESEEMSESSFYTSKVSWKTPEMGASKYFKSLAEKADKFEEHNKITKDRISEIAQGFYETKDPIDVDFENGVFKLHKGNDIYTKDQLIEDFDNKIQQADSQADKNVIARQKQNMLNKLAILESNEIQANAHDREIEHLNNGVKNQLRDDPELGNYANMLTFGEDGSINIDESKLQSAIQRGIVKEESKDVSSTLGTSVTFPDIDTKSVRDGEVVRTRALDISATGGARERGEVFLTRENGELKYYTSDQGKIGRILNKASNLQQKRVDQIRDAGKHKNVIGVALNPKNKTHESIIATIENRVISPESADGSITDSKGNTISRDNFDPNVGDRFMPKDIAMVEGEAVVTGYIANSDGNPKEELENLTLRGEMAKSFARDLYGADYHNVLSAESFKQFLPQLINDGEDVNISSETVNNLLNTGYSDDITIKYKNTTDTYGDKDTFRIFHKGKEVWRAHDPYEVITGLLQYDQDLQAE